VLPSRLSGVLLYGCRPRVTVRENPLHLKTPIHDRRYVYGALSRNAKEALGLAQLVREQSTCTGDGGMHPADREYSKTLVYNASHRATLQSGRPAPRRCHRNSGRQGREAGNRRFCFSTESEPRDAQCETFPTGSTSAVPAATRIWMGPEDLTIKI